MRKKKRHGAIALLEFESVAAGILASDAMVKRSPIALLRCGSIHPGRFLILVGGSVASTEEAFAAGLQVGDGMVVGTDQGPLISEAAVDKVEAEGDEIIAATAQQMLGVSENPKLGPADEALRRVPGCIVAADQPYRELDLAIDFAEDTGPLDDAAIDAIVAVFVDHGAHAKVSNIHVNGWYGDYDKLGMCLAMARRYAEEGARVAVCDLDGEAIAALPDGIWGVRADVTDEALGDDPPPDRLHRVRIDAKKLRYLLEFFSGGCRQYPRHH